LLDGNFEIHGCDPKETYQVFFLDAKNKLGATVEISGKQAQGKPITVQLAACGQAQVRVLDSLERPVNLGVSAHLVLTPGPTRLNDFGNGKVFKQGLTWADEIDLHHGSPISIQRVLWGQGVVAPVVPAFVRDKDGYRFTHLIPGATYRLSYINGQRAKGGEGAVVREFTVKAGETLRLPNITVKK